MFRWQNFPVGRVRGPRTASICNYYKSSHLEVHSVVWDLFILLVGGSIGEIANIFSVSLGVSPHRGNGGAYNC